eukprot:1138713-Pelagomonas_calceolata.AAC.1
MGVKMVPGWSCGPFLWVFVNMIVIGMVRPGKEKQEGEQISVMHEGMSFVGCSQTYRTHASPKPCQG